MNARRLTVALVVTAVGAISALPDSAQANGDCNEFPAADVSAPLGSLDHPHAKNPVSGTATRYGAASGCYAGYYQVEATSTLPKTPFATWNVQMGASIGDSTGALVVSDKARCDTIKVEAEFWGYVEPGRPKAGWNYLGRSLKTGGVFVAADPARHAPARCEQLQVAHRVSAGPATPFTKLRVMAKATETRGAKGQVEVTGFVQNLQF